MKLVQSFGAVISLAMLAAGVFLLWEDGLSRTGISSFLATAVSGFCLSITLQIFTLRHRIDALEQAKRQGA